MSKRDLEQTVFLGGRISNKHTLFKTLAKLGYDEADQYAMIEFMEWFQNNPESDPFEMVKKAVELTGMASFLRNTTEITRLSMILGFSKTHKNWYE